MCESINRLWVNPVKRRYYRAFLCTDLLGDVLLHRSWGSLTSSRGASQCELVISWQDGLARLDSIAKTRRQHGYEPQ